MRNVIRNLVERNVESDYNWNLAIGVVILAITSYLSIAAWDIFILISVVVIILGASKVFKKMELSRATKKVLWSVSFILTLLTPVIIPIRVIDKIHFERLVFGFPFGFVEQYTRPTLAARDFPFTTTLVNPWGHSIAGNINIRVDLFIVSVVSTYLILFVLANIVNKVRSIKGNG